MRGPLAVRPTALVPDAWKMHPNPVRRYLTVDLPAGTAAELTVSSLIGTRVLRQLSPGGDLPARLDLSALPAGVYLLQVRSAAGSGTRRFVKE